MKRSREASFSPSAASDSADEDDSAEDTRITKISALATSQTSEAPPVMQCSLPPHTQSVHFPSIEAFEVHYLKDHSNRCASCTKNFPSAHFLSLHIDEYHNPLRAELEAKGEKTYACFVEDCEKLCSTPQKRRLQLIDKHLFPKSYNFRVTEYGIDKRTSMLMEKSHRRRVSTTTAPADGITRHRRSSSQQMTLATLPDTAEAPSTSGKHASAGSIAASKKAAAATVSTTGPRATDDSLGDLTDSLAALRFVPPSVRRQQSKKGP